MAKIKPGTPHPNKRGMVMGKNGRYVAKSTYNKQVKGTSTPSKSSPKAKPSVKRQFVKTNPTGAPRGAQGPRTAPVQGPSRRTPSTISGDTGRRGGVNKYGTAGTPKSGPPGLGKPPRFNPSVRRPGANPAALAQMTGLTIASKMAETIGKPGQSKMSGLGVDPSRLPKKDKKVERGAQGRNTKGGQGGSRASATRKPKQETKPKREVTSRNRRGRPTSYAKPVKPAKRGMSNIPPQEGTGRGSPNDKKPARQSATPKTQPKSQPKAQPKAQAKVKKGSGVERRLPKDNERKDRAYSAVQELRAMRERSKQRQGKKKKQSRANQAGYPGNRNY